MTSSNKGGLALIAIIGGLWLLTSKKSTAAPAQKTLPPIAPNLPTPSAGQNIVAPPAMTTFEAELMRRIDANAKSPTGLRDAMASMTSNNFMALWSLPTDTPGRSAAMAQELQTLYPGVPVPLVLTPAYEVMVNQVMSGTGWSSLKAQSEMLQQNPTALQYLTPSQQARLGVTTPLTPGTPDTTPQTASATPNLAGLTESQKLALAEWASYGFSPTPEELAFYLKYNYLPSAAELATGAPVIPAYPVTPQQQLDTWGFVVPTPGPAPASDVISDAGGTWVWDGIQYIPV